jgi:hypothetical protein
VQEEEDEELKMDLIKQFDAARTETETIIGDSRGINKSPDSAFWSPIFQEKAP